MISAIYSFGLESCCCMWGIRAKIFSAKPTKFLSKSCKFVKTALQIPLMGISNFLTYHASIYTRNKNVKQFRSNWVFSRFMEQVKSIRVYKQSDLPYMQPYRKLSISVKTPFHGEMNNMTPLDQIGVYIRKLNISVE